MQSSKTALILMIMAISGAAAGQQPPAPPFPPAAAVSASDHINTVESMLVIDSQMALDKLKADAEKAAPHAMVSGPVVAPVAAPPTVIEVLSVLGIGDEKKATILIDGKRHSQLVVGSKAGKYVVREIGGGCVDLVIGGKGKATKATKGKRAKGKVNTKGVKHVCFDPDADYAPAPVAGAYYAGQSGGGIQSRMTVAPLPLPVIPVPSAASRVNPM